MKKGGLVTVPRALGVLLLVLGILTFGRVAGSFLLLIAGVILLIAKNAQRHLDSFVRSFENGKIIVTTALYDSLFWMILFGTGAFYGWRLKLRAGDIQAANVLSRESLMDPVTAAQSASAVKGLVLFFVIGLSLLAVINVISYTFFRGLTLTTLTNKTFDRSYFKKFLKLNSVWWLLWGIPIILLASAASQTSAARIAIIVVLVVAMYFTLFVHALFAKKQKVSQALGHGIAYGITRLPSLAVPFTYAFILYVIIYQLFQLFQFWPSRTVQAISLLFVILYLAWLRTYLYPIIAGFKEE